MVTASASFRSPTAVERRLGHPEAERLVAGAGSRVEQRLATATEVEHDAAAIVVDPVAGSP